MTNSRAKGVKGELEWGKFLRDHGFPARRGQQYSGNPDAPDVICEALPKILFEVKRVEQFHLYKAMEQASNDAGRDKVPVVVHRKNGEEWVVVMRAEDWLELLKPFNPYEDLSDIIYETQPTETKRGPTLLDVAHDVVEGNNELLKTMQDRAKIEELIG